MLRFREGRVRYIAPDVQPTEEAAWKAFCPQLGSHDDIRMYRTRTNKHVLACLRTSWPFFGAQPPHPLTSHHVYRHAAQDLTLECEARPAALTPLAGLPRLENLRVILQPGDDAAAWSADSVAAVFMSVVLNAPAIRQIRIRPWRVLHNHKWLDAAIEKGVEHMQAFLRQVERNPALVELER